MSQILRVAQIAQNLPVCSECNRYSEPEGLQFTISIPIQISLVEITENYWLLQFPFKFISATLK